MNIWSAGRFRLGWILIAIAAINALGWTIVRWSYENTLRSAQLTIDYEDMRTLADAYQVPHATLLNELKLRGVRSVALYNQSVNNFRDNGRIAVTPRAEAERLFPDVKWSNYLPAYRYIITATGESQGLLDQIRAHLQGQSQPSLPPMVIVLRAARKGNPRDTAQFGIAVPASRQLLSDAYMGYDPKQVQSVKEAGLEITARMSNALNLNSERMRSMLDEAQAVGARTVIFSDDEVVGYDSIIPEVAREMRSRGLLFGNIEFTKQRGWQDFSKLTDGLLVRVHSIGPDEVAKAKTELLVERFTRSVKERNIRVPYIRLIRQYKGESAPADEPAGGSAQGRAGSSRQAAPALKQTKTALEQNLDFVQEISHSLQAQPVPGAPWLRPGLVMGPAVAFGDYPLDWLSPRVGGLRNAKIIRYIGLFLSGLGAIGGTLLLLNLFFDLGRRQRLWLFVGLILVGVLSAFPGMGAKLMALQVGCLLPTIAILWGGLPLLWNSSNPHNPDDLGFDTGPVEEPANAADAADGETTRWRAFWTGCGILVKTSLLTALGGMIVIALLNQWKFFSGADKFLLPKATQLLPLLLVAAAFAGEAFPHRVVAEGADPARRRTRERVNNILSYPFTARIALLALVLFVAGFIWIARTGNESGMEISGFELMVRNALEQVFITRPRTKEIFLGTPAMIFAVWFALNRRWTPAFAAAILATIGQADMLNTFCHIHTPIFYSLLRTIHGVWVGAIIGGVALWAYTLIAGWFSRRGRPAHLPRPSAGRPAETKAAANSKADGSGMGTIFVPPPKDVASR